jgi:hypothetical protein
MESCGKMLRKGFRREQQSEIVTEENRKQIVGKHELNLFQICYFKLSAVFMNCPNPNSR